MTVPSTQDMKMPSRQTAQVDSFWVEEHHGFALSAVCGLPAPSLDGCLGFSIGESGPDQLRGGETGGVFCKESTQRTRTKESKKHACVAVSLMPSRARTEQQSTPLSVLCITLRRIASHRIVAREEKKRERKGRRP